jgi:hypothetical protein
MGKRWRQFLSWRCESCGTDNVILERVDAAADKSGTFARICLGCSTQAPGTTIRPVGVAYLSTTRKNWHPGLS